MATGGDKKKRSAMDDLRAPLSVPIIVDRGLPPPAPKRGPGSREHVTLPADPGPEPREEPRRIIVPGGGVAPALPKGLVAPTLGSEPASAELDRVAQSCFDVWAQFTGLKVDGYPVDLDGWRFLIDIYRAFGDMTEGSRCAWLKPAQVGATTAEQLLLLWAATNFQIKCGIFFPGKDELNELVADRFQPLIESNPRLAAAIHPHVNRIGLKRIRNVHGGYSSIYMRNIGGRSATESIPLDLVLLDEVRVYPDQAVVEKVMKRLQASRWRIARFASTAGLPEQDIDEYYRAGTRELWLSKCRCSDGGVDLGSVFPDCIGYKDNKPAFYRCPRCKTIIRDPQNGAYVAQIPDAAYRSFNCSSMVSPRVSPASIMWDYEHTKDHEEFVRANLGRAFVDRKNLPVTADVLKACTPGLSGGDHLPWAYLRPDLKGLRTRCAMGVDQGGNYLYVTILRRARDGLLDLVHFEIPEADNPHYWRSDAPEYSQFPRFHQLMREFNVECCVLDHEPNYAPALECANAFPGRVFLSKYQGDKMAYWRDQDEDMSSGERLQTPWQVDLNRYKAMDYAFKLLIDRRIRLPNPEELVQVCKHETQGRFVPQRVFRRFWKHLTKMVRHRKIKNPETGEAIMEFRGPRADHAAHSFTYACMAAERVLASSAVYL